MRVAAATSFAAALAILSGGAAGAQAAKSLNAGSIEEGRRVFNTNCAHCHGEDAAAEDSFYNLPQLLSDKRDSFFFAAVTKGIVNKGMPAWKGILKRRDMANILAFLRSLEREQGPSEKGGENN